MRIITANVNGIRSATSKGFFEWAKRQRPDVVCLQETKAHRSQLDDHPCFPRGWHCDFNDAESRGYSGVAIYSRRQPDAVLNRLGWDEFDREGRYLEARFGNLSVVSLYLPSGSSSGLRQSFKFRVMDWLAPHLEAWSRNGRQYVLCGDWNIAHQAIDLKNWRSNQKNSGFLPEERAWLGRVFAPEAWVDAWLKHILEAAPGAVADAKALARDFAGAAVTDALRAESARRIAARRADPEGREGVAAFLAKRIPDWVVDA